MPPEVMKRLIKRDLAGKEGAERVRVLKQALENLPGYYQGPYGKLRKWIKEEMEASRRRSKVPRRESFQVPKEGHRQVAVVGPPNAGKSALLKALSGAQVKVADYPFATLKPQAAMVDFYGARIQLVEVPGLLPGANDDAGGGRALLAAVRTADLLLYVTGLATEGAGLQDLRSVRQEVLAAGIQLPEALVFTGLDRVSGGDLEAGKTGVPDIGDLPSRLGGDFSGPVTRCSTVTGEGLDDLKAALWPWLGLMRIRRWGESGPPFVLDEGSTVADLARAIHKDFGARLSQALVWGTSAKFPGQAVGVRHVLADGDEVELKLRG